MCIHYAPACGPLVGASRMLSTSAGLVAWVGSAIVVAFAQTPCGGSLNQSLLGGLECGGTCGQGTSDC